MNVAEKLDTALVRDIVKVCWSEGSWSEQNPFDLAEPYDLPESYDLLEPYDLSEIVT